MRILDIDLDFFQFGRMEDVPNDTKGRPGGDRVKPWSVESTIEFLEGRCHLNKKNKINGCIVEQHHEVFHLWKQMIAQNQHIPPFTVYHVDAHADLGMGDSSWCYIVGELLHRPLNQRSNVPISGPEKLNCGNYLAFAIANRWIRKLNFIINPNWHDDIPGCYFKREGEIPYGYHNLLIQLKKYSHEQINEMAMTRSEPEPLGYEPEVPFEIMPHEEFNATCQFDYVFLSTSPSYTNPATDKLISIILDYIEK